ncbi:MAG: FAD:protein FMN transferase [Geminicoccaceae bacterium]|nr:FAD:protein FMN transferase [Geminicoccaceae bacterium]
MRRRRLLQITAALAVTLPLPGSAAPPPLVRWRGAVLGAEATIALAHRDEAAARRLITGCVDEARRLEAVFSLYRPDSAINRLNRTGSLIAPPLDLVRCLLEARRVSAATGGAFDATVQPLWRLYADHFAAPGADPAGPDPAAVAGALALVGWRGVTVGADEVRLERPGMALSLNGIAQGFITDAVAERLRAEGATDVLVDLGEVRGLGSRPDGGPWRVGVAAPGGRLETVALRGSALATSSPLGTFFDPARRFHHLLDPHTGRPAGNARQVSVAAASAARADALSTAFAVLPQEALPAAVRAWPGTAAFVVGKDGAARWLTGAGPVRSG